MIATAFLSSKAISVGTNDPLVRRSQFTTCRARVSARFGPQAKNIGRAKQTWRWRAMAHRSSSNGRADRTAVGTASCAEDIEARVAGEGAAMGDV